MNINRCAWCGTDPLYVKYHDEEWGVPVNDDLRHFEFMILESMQAGLSWLTVLRKRENFRKALDGFDPHVVAKYNNTKVEQLLLDPGIIRNRLKINACINNASQFLRVRDEFGTFNQYIWSFTDYKPIINNWATMDQVPASTPISDKISKDLVKRGFKFVGTTIIYAHMQAIGIVNDHLVSCFRHKEVTITGQ